MLKKITLALLLIPTLCLAGNAHLRCEDMGIGRDHEFDIDHDKMGILINKATNGKRSFDGRYDIETVISLCNGETDADNYQAWIDRGYIKRSEIEAIKEELGLETRSKDGIRFEKVNNFLLYEVKLCTACASGPADKYVNYPESKCANLIERAMNGDKNAIDKVKQQPDYCALDYKTDIKPAVATIDKNSDTLSDKYICNSPYQKISSFSVGCKFDEEKYKEKIISEFRHEFDDKGMPFYKRYTLKGNDFFDFIEVTVNDSKEIILLIFSKNYFIEKEYVFPVNRVFESPDFLQGIDDFEVFKNDLSERWGVNHEDYKKDPTVIWRPQDADPIEEVSLVAKSTIGVLTLELKYLSNTWLRFYEKREISNKKKTDGF